MKTCKAIISLWRNIIIRSCEEANCMWVRNKTRLQQRMVQGVWRELVSLLHCSEDKFFRIYWTSKCVPEWVCMHLYFEWGLECSLHPTHCLGVFLRLALLALAAEHIFWLFVIIIGTYSQQKPLGRLSLIHGHACISFLISFSSFLFPMCNKLSLSHCWLYARSSNVRVPWWYMYEDICQNICAIQGPF